MKRYICGKIEAATVPQEEINDVHSLSMFIGAYLVYSGKPNYPDFKEFAKANHLLYEDNQVEYFWSYVNKGQMFIRDKVNLKSSKYIFITSFPTYRIIHLFYYFAKDSFPCPKVSYQILQLVFMHKCLYHWFVTFS